MNYLSVGNDAKTVKGQKKGVLTGILYMAPHTLGGGKTLCPFSTAGCRAVCLYTAGRGGFTMVQEARVRKTQAFLANSFTFAEKLCEDIKLLCKQAAKQGMVPAVRLNGTTDIEWEKHGIMQAFPDVQFYDYTKWPASRRLNLPANYHLTYSFSEKKDAPLQLSLWRARGVNTAVVFNQKLPDTWTVCGYDLPVINGDESDLRFTDPIGVIVGLKTKGKARKADVGPGHFVQEGRVAA
jgi:hypothetical protein